MYSIDIAKERLDEQDKKIIKHVMSQEWKIKRCLILGSGEGRIGVLLALFGFEVVCVDVTDYSNFYSKANELLDLKKPMSFIQGSISNAETLRDSGEFSLVLGQRVLHYLPYEEAEDLLTFLPKIMTKRGYLYLAVSCIDSVMGDEYVGNAQYIENRFEKLSLEMQGRFRLTVPVCLYSLRDFKLLMQGSHFKKRKLYQTSFGNIKGLYQL